MSKPTIIQCGIQFEGTADEIAEKVYFHPRTQKRVFSMPRISFAQLLTDFTNRGLNHD